MKKIFALIPVLIVSLFSSAYAEEPLMIEELSPSGKVLVKLEWTEVQGFRDVSIVGKNHCHPLITKSQLFIRNILSIT